MWKKYWNQFWRLVMSHRYITASVLAVLAGGAVTALLFWDGSVEAAYQEGIAGEIIRFHVLANSNEEEDQDLKLKVKGHIVSYMEELLVGADDLDETRAAIFANMEEIEAEALAVIEEEGYSYSVSVELGQAYFPIKTYGEYTFPAGDYEALQIKIGAARGKNWWCVLYPSLCFVDVTHGVVPESSDEKLRNILTEEEYEAITEKPEIRIKFKYLEPFF